MIEVKKMAENEATAVIADTSSCSCTPAVAAPPQRRPRVREVSSRFMSPLASSASSSDQHPVTAKSPHHKQQQQQQQQRHRRQQDNKDTESVSSADENRPIETARSLESPLQFHSSKERRHQQQQPRSVMKLFNDNSNNTSKFAASGRCSNSSRPDTPTVSNLSRPLPRTLQLQRSTSGMATAATKLLQSISTQPSNAASSQNDASSSDVVDDICRDSCTSDTDMLPTVSARSRTLAERNIINRVHGTATPCSRSLHLQPQLSNSQQHNGGFFSSIKGGEKPTSALSRSFSNSAKIGGLPLPPIPPPTGTDSRKGRKVSSHQEDLHSLKLLHNHYLQWRFANAKADSSTLTQRKETEKSLYSLGVKISELYASVKRKRIELEILKRIKTLSTILEAQMPYLDEWCAFEGDYSSSLSEAIQALLGASIQLPIGGNVKADVREVGEALNSAAKLMEMIILHLQSFMPEAEEVEMLISELAKVTGGERALVEECGGLLSKTHTFQVEECSLRGQLMQLHQRVAVADQSQKDTNNSSLNAAVNMR